MTEQIDLNKEAMDELNELRQWKSQLNQQAVAPTIETGLLENGMPISDKDAYDALAAQHETNAQTYQAPIQQAEPIKTTLSNMPISAEAFKQYSTRIVEISGFDEGTKIPIQIKSVGLLGMLRSGKISNTLLNQVTEVFGEDTNVTKEKVEQLSTQNNGQLVEMSELLETFASQVMVKPTFQEVGDYMTDTQLMEIFEIAQGGIKELEDFR